MNISISIFLFAPQTCSGELQQGVQQADGDRVPARISQPWIWIQQRLVVLMRLVFMMLVPVSQPGCNAALDVDTAKVSVHEGCW